MSLVVVGFVLYNDKNINHDFDNYYAQSLVMETEISMLHYETSKKLLFVV